MRAFLRGPRHMTASSGFCSMKPAQQLFAVITLHVSHFCWNALLSQTSGEMWLSKASCCLVDKPLLDTAWLSASCYLVVTQVVTQVVTRWLQGGYKADIYRAADCMCCRKWCTDRHVHYQQLLWSLHADMACTAYAYTCSGRCLHGIAVFQMCLSSRTIPCVCMALL